MSQSGSNSEKATPVPVPNTEVKFLCADDTWGATPWESRTLPVFSKIAQLVEQSAVNRKVVGSSPTLGAKI